jgi:chromosome segregation ATPase
MLSEERLVKMRDHASSIAVPFHVTQIVREMIAEVRRQRDEIGQLATGHLEAQHRAAKENTRLRNEVNRQRAGIEESRTALNCYMQGLKDVADGRDKLLDEILTLNALNRELTAEVTGLKADNKRLRQMVEQSVDQAAEIDRLEAEVKRLSQRCAVCKHRGQYYVSCNKWEARE